VAKKPFTENSDAPDREDHEIAAEYWANHLARNKSIIVDLMTGQLKSTVTCQECGWVTIAFDPMTSVQVPIPTDTSVDVTYQPYRMTNEKTGEKL
jgi:ubiquitin carboxyl-terminal hydrolase 4/11/15